MFSNADLTWMWRHGYDALIRKHALGRFDQMLQAAIIHPTMLTYLDADVSMVVRSSAGVVELINENLGRELLELHTVGRTAGYTESMVKDSAYILTGWTIDRMRTWARSYEPNIHYTGPVSVLEFSSPNDQRDGRQVLRNYLQYLAHHPATAQRIARKLAVRFVSDTPSQRLVDHLATVFQNSGTDIKTTLRALVRDREFKGSAGDKVRTPTDDMAATVRALGATMVRTAQGDGCSPGDLPPEQQHRPDTLRMGTSGRLPADRGRLVDTWPADGFVPGAQLDGRPLVPEHRHPLPAPLRMAAAEAHPVRPAGRPSLPDPARQERHVQPARRGVRASRGQTEHGGHAGQLHCSLPDAAPDRSLARHSRSSSRGDGDVRLPGPGPLRPRLGRRRGAVLVLGLLGGHLVATVVPAQRPGCHRRHGGDVVVR